MCYDLLGVETNDNVFKGGRLSLLWLAQQFDNCDNLPKYAFENQLRQYTRAYIRTIIDRLIFPGKSNSQVHLPPPSTRLNNARTYSWGVGFLAWLYKQLCKTTVIDEKNIVDPLLLLQIWAWDPFPLLAHRRLHRYYDHLGDRLLAV